MSVVRWSVIDRVPNILNDYVTIRARCQTGPVWFQQGTLKAARSGSTFEGTLTNHSLEGTQNFAVYCIRFPLQLAVVDLALYQAPGRFSLWSVVHVCNSGHSSALPFCRAGSILLSPL